MIDIPENVDIDDFRRAVTAIEDVAERNCDTPTIACAAMTAIAVNLALHIKLSKKDYMERVSGIWDASEQGLREMRLGIVQ